MTVYINNELQTVPVAVTLAEALPSLAEKRGVAIAVNDEVVPRTEWNIFRLKEHDRLVVIRASQGG